MGYTHYWTHKRAFTNAEWAEVARDLSAIIKTAQSEGLKVGDTLGESEVESLQIERDDSGAWAGFNGVGEDAHETFMIWQKRRPLESWQSAKDRGGDFCKTARKFYDVAVTACLCYLESVYPERFNVSSDGRAHEWQEGLALARRALPRLHNVLRIPAEVEFDSLFARTHFSGGGFALSSLHDGTLCIADHRTLTIAGKFTGAESVEWVKGWAERVARERQGLLPARVDFLERWAARKMRTLIQAGESFAYLNREPQAA